MALESFAQTADQVLLGNLDFKLPPGGSYIVDRSQAIYYTSAAGTFSSSGVRTFKINLTSENAFADLSTAVLSFRLKNVAADRGFADNKVNTGAVYRLKPKAGPHAFIYRLRVLCAGQPAEQILNTVGGTNCARCFRLKIGNSTRALATSCWTVMQTHDLATRSDGSLMETP